MALSISQSYTFFISEIGVLAEFVRYAHGEELIPTELLTKVNNALANLRKNFLSLTAIENARKKEEFKSKRISEEDIKDFYESAHCTRIRSYIDEKPDILSVKVTVYLLILIIPSYLTPGGVFTKMKMKII